MPQINLRVDDETVRRLQYLSERSAIAALVTEMLEGNEVM